MEKAVPFEQARELAEALRRAGKRVVLCHGTFDLVHPGHVLFLEEARALGDVLIVSVRAGDKVHKGPGRPLFTDALRVRSLAGLACVDHVVVVPFSDGADAVRHLQATLRRLGLFRAMKRLGAHAGQTICIGGVELEYRPD